MNKTYYRIIMITAIAFVLGIGAKALTTNSGAAKIAVVDVKQVVNVSKDVAELRKLNQERSKELQEWIKNKTAEIEKKAGNDKKKGAELAAKSNEELVAKQQAMQEEYAAALQKIDDKISAQMADLAKKEGFDVVFAKEVVLEGGIDITDKVIEMVK
ncbi:MAG: OmpH family outer membrane protein [Rhodospirillales bacterium]|nr:OmpH family outer membrane protein [Rhodospirillales bacterium]